MAGLVKAAETVAIALVDRVFGAPEDETTEVHIDVDALAAAVADKLGARVNDCSECECGDCQCKCHGSDEEE